MPRPRKRCRCRRHDGDRVFKPRSVPMTGLATVTLALRELEAVRSCDLDGLDQQAAGRRMGVSRGTVQRLLASGRRKLVQVIVENSALVVEEGASDEDLRTDR